MSRQKDQNLRLLLKLEKRLIFDNFLISFSFINKKNTQLSIVQIILGATAYSGFFFLFFPVLRNIILKLNEQEFCAIDVRA